MGKYHGKVMVVETQQYKVLSTIVFPPVRPSVYKYHIVFL